ncbi:MAG: 50S ribosomal protein L24 [Hyphomonadaceae bacterium]|nr:MAG: large subunit ribosomal protein L24 [Caulobacteraceae bacterium]MBT9447483.1 50S ribosomal protein L24 [Hyphomonadaceae bacterium]TPW08492.1 MAG: large subunit ribosomal protein L24 [Alphaproteobacteria bacterium]
MAAKIKKGDTVVVLSGKDKGNVGKVTKVFPEAERVIVEGVHIIAKHVKPSMEDPNGGIKRYEAPIHVSKVAVRDPSTGKATRVGFKTLPDGRKVRVAKGSGVQIDV